MRHILARSSFTIVAISIYFTHGELRLNKMIDLYTRQPYTGDKETEFNINSEYRTNFTSAASSQSTAPSSSSSSPLSLSNPNLYVVMKSGSLSAHFSTNFSLLTVNSHNPFNESGDAQNVGAFFIVINQVKYPSIYLSFFDENNG
ncbi:hypothetical protein SK128_009606 [Halocaridina rubra]|uniref:Uncharacterized protein n=1 Tax=Halocaridina rubra TaxID=373956 RepID=A0AAN8XG66_HALRR